MLNLNKSKIKQLKQLLDDISYDLIVNTLIDRPTAEIESYTISNKIKIIIKIFFFHKDISIFEVKKNIGLINFENLRNLGLFYIKNNKVSSNYRIYSFQNYYFVSNYVDYKALDYAYFGKDSLLLARYLPYNFVAKNILDLCTGTGIQAILMSKNIKNIVGVDVSPIACNVAQFNVILNQVEENLKIVQGNLFAPIKKKKFDLIICNPPYISIPHTLKYPLCGNGGEDGLIVLREIIKNLDSHLEERGLSLILCNTIGDKSGPFLIQILKELSKQSHWNIEVILLERRTKEEEIFNRSILLMSHNQHNNNNPMLELDKMYSQMKAEYAYVYLLKIKRGKNVLKIVDLIENKNHIYKNKITDVTSFKILELMIKNSFQNGFYKKAMELFELMEKFHLAFNIPYPQEISQIVKICKLKLDKIR